MGGGGGAAAAAVVVVVVVVVAAAAAAVVVVVVVAAAAAMVVGGFTDAAHQPSRRSKKAVDVARTRASRGTNGGERRLWVCDRRARPTASRVP